MPKNTDNNALTPGFDPTSDSPAPQGAGVSFPVRDAVILEGVSEMMQLILQDQPTDQAVKP